MYLCLCLEWKSCLRRPSRPFSAKTASQHGTCLPKVYVPQRTYTSLNQTRLATVQALWYSIYHGVYHHPTGGGSIYCNRFSNLISPQRTGCQHQKIRYLEEKFTTAPSVGVDTLLVVAVEISRNTAVPFLLYDRRQCVLFCLISQGGVVYYVLQSRI